jgi:preprotein translocase subunit SecA
MVIWGVYLPCLKKKVVMSFLQKIFGSNDREIDRFRPTVEKIASLEEGVQKMSSEELKNKSTEFHDRFTAGETLDEMLPEAFAVVREVAKRTIGERHYDVQMLGGMVLHSGKIAEMKTGEGKTLTSTLPIYLNAITKKGVHVVTVNDYLAKRDCNWMGQVFEALGLTSSCIVSQGLSYRYTHTVDDNGDAVSIEEKNLVPITRNEAYQADITYGTNNEFGFDFLRDNMVQDLSQMSQRNLHFAIVDEVDSILIDEARTPLIISAPDSESTKLYEQFAHIVPKLKVEEHYVIDEKMKVVTLTDDGVSAVEKMLGQDNIYATGNIQYVHHLEQSLKASIIFQRDKDYVVQEGEVIIVDDFTGRLQPGRRYSEGLHQAIEAKEKVTVQKESRTLATITFQNYFRLYEKIAGMTGTALTSAEELGKVYKLDVLEIPTNKNIIRQDLPDVIFKTEEGKYKQLVEKVKEVHKTGQPVLIGTVAIEKSEYLHKLLENAGVTHEVLNAKQHEREAHIITNAGQKGAVTIATNMAGRGTDIKLGDGVREVGGLMILGSERHEARRIDNQLRGRAGRQGDPGVSQFYVSLEDELMRRFGGEKMKNMMTTLGLPDDEPIQNGIISKSIENAQSKIEGFNFDIRKNILEYDDVMNKQREVVYRKRRAVLKGEEENLSAVDLITEELDTIISVHTFDEEASWDIQNIVVEANAFFPTIKETEATKILEDIRENMALDDHEKREKIIQYFQAIATTETENKITLVGAESWKNIEKQVYLRTLDTLWMNHLDEIDYLRQGIGLRGYGQRDPLIEYKKEAFIMFSRLMETVRKTFLLTVLKIEVRQEVPIQASPQNMVFSGASDNESHFSGSEGAKTLQGLPIKPLVGRNEPCPCGSGKKYKKCGMISAPGHKQIA